ncbi:hypothetical protein G9U52_33525 [Paenibacillus sp. S3N08]|uniref:Uncharacterized protein n=1 Tax=Paenibacillus agricola TaxID=2716264 RepID=A0ABX0JHB7_9BACL|nr:hypothetical protein [Paenibacillus agricola]
MKVYFSRQFYFIFVELCVGYMLLIGSLFSSSSFIQYCLLLYCCITTYYFIDIIMLQKKIRREYNISGFKRWDNTLEIHIANRFNNAIEFQKNLINTIEYCKQNNLKIEFVTGLFSFGRMVRLFGDSLLLIKPLGFFSQLLIGVSVKSFEKKPNFNSDHLHKVVLNPQSIKIKENQRNGKKYFKLK